MKTLTRFLVLTGVALLAQMHAHAQTPDTVCVNSSAVPYSVTNVPTSTYAWTLSGGGTLSSPSGNAITVNWGGTPGTYQLQVQETSGAGCEGDPVSLNVVVIPLATASISGSTAMCYSDGQPTITISLTGVAPYDFTYTDGTTPVTVNGWNSSTYTFTASAAVPPAGGSPAVTTYSMVSVQNKFCSGTTSGSAAVTVNPKPVTSAISH